jgi:hypothetical protein
MDEQTMAHELGIVDKFSFENCDREILNNMALY